eukprot:gene5708-10958_t
MPNCGAFGCTNRSSHNKELTFHQIPGEGRNKQLRKMWLTNIRRAGELPKDKSFYICSEHFAEDCYERDFKKELMENKPGAKKLEADAIPTIFIMESRLELVTQKHRSEDQLFNANVCVGCFNQLGSHWVLIVIYPLKRLVQYVNPVRKRNSAEFCYPAI